MEIIIEAPFNLSDTQEASMKEQINKLERYNNKITQTQVYFKKDDGTQPQVILAEIQVHVPGPVIFASDTADNATEAFSGALSKVDRLMRKAKEKRNERR